MTDYFAKARKGRIIALNLYQSGAVMFFPEEFGEIVSTERSTSRHVVTQMSKPMFVRSVSVQSGALIEAPRPEKVANAPFVLTEEHAVENVLRLVA
ncbi:hypothetical protein [Celeribacter sp. SCSIO 80788]|uniref:hypothetical protein n=1 Tax=Celeribacter sp. SCSIO 80788 TaxID=3117013 RepID=UPI003DA43D12